MKRKVILYTLLVIGVISIPLIRQPKIVTTAQALTTTETTIYVVQDGDCLSVIAQKFNSSVSELRILNPWIVNPSGIDIGWELIVPIRS